MDDADEAKEELDGSSGEPPTAASMNSRSLVTRSAGMKRAHPQYDSIEDEQCQNRVEQQQNQIDHPESIWLPRCGEYDRYDHACLLEY